MPHQGLKGQFGGTVVTVCRVMLCHAVQVWELLLWLKARTTPQQFSRLISLTIMTAVGTVVGTVVLLTITGTSTHTRALISVEMQWQCSTMDLRTHWVSALFAVKGLSACLHPAVTAPC